MLLKRAIHIIFCVYFIALAFMPCYEQSSGDDCCKAKTSQQASNDVPTDEVCSPFCSGSCCTPHLLMKDFHTTLVQVAVVNTIYTKHNDAELSEIALPIWQPPKLNFIS